MTKAEETLFAPLEETPVVQPLNETKPHKGRLSEWRIIDWYGKDCVVGKFLDHEEFAGYRGHTSYILRRLGNEIETRNSRYTLEGPEEDPLTRHEVMSSHV
jgi:hypothetical protein